MLCNRLGTVEQFIATIAAASFCEACGTKDKAEKREMAPKKNFECRLTNNER